MSHTTLIYEIVPAFAPVSLCDCCVLGCSLLVTTYLQHMHTYMVYRLLSFKKKMISCCGAVANSAFCDVYVLKDGHKGWFRSIIQREESFGKLRGQRFGMRQEVLGTK